MSMCTATRKTTTPKPLRADFHCFLYNKLLFFPLTNSGAMGVYSLLAGTTAACSITTPSATLHVITCITCTLDNVARRGTGAESEIGAYHFMERHPFPNARRLFTAIFGSTCNSRISSSWEFCLSDENDNRFQLEVCCFFSRPWPSKISVHTVRYYSRKYRRIIDGINIYRSAKKNESRLGRFVKERIYSVIKSLARPLSPIHSVFLGSSTSINREPIWIILCHGRLSQMKNSLRRIFFTVRETTSLPIQNPICSILVLILMRGNNDYSGRISAG